MEKLSLFKRAIIPALSVITAMILSGLLYDLSRGAGTGFLRKAILYPSVVIMFLSTWLGPLFLVPIAFHRCAKPIERYVAALAAPIIWTMKTLYYFVGLYSVSELFFLLFHPFILGCIGVNLLCVGSAELVCRALQRRREGKTAIRLTDPAPVSFFALGLVITFLGLWNGGHSYYYIYMDVYSGLFL